MAACLEPVDRMVDAWAGRRFESLLVVESTSDFGAGSDYHHPPTKVQRWGHFRPIDDICAMSAFHPIANKLLHYGK
jgi:hypothetical protein